MKFLPLIWSGIWRKPGRTILIFLQVSVAFALFGVLQGLKTGVQHAVDAARADLLIVHSRLSLIMEGLPISLLGPIRSVPGVRVAIPVELFICQFQKPEQGVLSVAVTPDKDWTTAFTFAIAPQDLDAFAKSRTAALVLEATAKKYGWKIGDRIPLICRTVQKNGSPNWTFEVVGTFTDSDFGGGGDKIIMSFPY
ncbi:MAG: ABC transporter permease, partial [Gammaproteobacteria bacterium]